MRVEFQAWVGDNCIYRMDFPNEEPWQLGDFSKVAMDDFHRKYPHQPVFDVTFKWANFVDGEAEQ